MDRFRSVLWITSNLLAVVAGLAAPRPACAAPAPVVAPAPPVAREVTFKGAGGLVLQGTLLLPVPQPNRKMPAMLLLAGSGPTNRDGGSSLVPGASGDGLLKQIAVRLASAGIATLRYDKRATAGYAAHWPKDPVALNAFFSWKSFVADAQAGLDFLRVQPEIDPARVGVLGHSEGGSIAVQLGAQTTTTRPAALALVGTPGRSLRPILTEQMAFSLGNSVKAGQISRADADKLESECQRIMGAIMATGKVPGDVPPALAPLFPAYASDLLQNYLTIDNSHVIAAYPGPVVIVQGEKDVQVSATKDAPPLLQALQVRAKGVAELFIVTSASHNLRHVDDPTKELGMSGPVVPAALDSIAAFLTTALKP